MRCPKCGNELNDDHCLYCILFNPTETTAASAPTTSIPAFTATIANDADSAIVICQHCGLMTTRIKNRCDYCKSVLKCDLCNKDMDKIILPQVAPHDHEMKRYGNFPDGNTVRKVSSYLKIKDFVNFTHASRDIYCALYFPPVNRTHRSTLIKTRRNNTSSAHHGYEIITNDNRKIKGVRIEHICKTCLNKIREISFTNCELEGTLPAMQNLKKLSFRRCKLSGILPNMQIDELHLDRCEFSMGIDEFISRVTVVVRIFWDHALKNMHEMITNVKKIGNRKITIRIHVHEPMVSNARWEPLLSEAIANKNILLVRCQHLSGQEFRRNIVTFYLPGKNNNYFCTKCWKGFNRQRTVCNAGVQVGLIETECPSREFYICDNGIMKKYVPDQLTPVIRGQQLAPEANNENKGVVNEIEGTMNRSQAISPITTTTSLLQQQQHLQEAVPISHHASREVSSRQDNYIDLTHNLGPAVADERVFDEFWFWQITLENEQQYIYSLVDQKPDPWHRPRPVLHFISPLRRAQPASYPAAQPVLTQHPMHGQGLRPQFSEQQRQQQWQQPLVPCSINAPCTTQSAPYRNTAQVQGLLLGMPHMQPHTTTMQHLPVQNQMNTSPVQQISVQHSMPGQVFTPPLPNQQLQHQHNQSDQNWKRLMPGDPAAGNK